MKQCKRCGDTLPLDCFANKSKAPDGKQSYCRTCMTVARAEWRAENRKHNNLIAAVYYYRNRKRIREQRRQAA